MNVIEFMRLVNSNNKEEIANDVRITDEFLDNAFNKISEVGKILSDYEKKHELKHSCFGESYFQSDSIMIEGSQEVFPEIMNLLLSEIDDESK